MNTSNPQNRFRTVSLFAIVLPLLSLVFSAPPTHGWAALPQAAECQSGVGGRLFATGGELEVEMIASNAGFNLELYLMSPGPQRFVATNRDPGAIVKLGSFPAGAELKFGVYVRDTQNTFLMGSGSGNTDGLPHAEVTCFEGNRSVIGFEDQLGGGDKDYNDLLFTVRQLIICNYSISPPSQSFGSGGGRGSVSLNASGGCSWNATSNVSWVTITSGGAGSDSGTVNYAVALNTSADSRTGTITLQGQTFTVYQDADSSQPLITGALRTGKKLFIYGINFDLGSVILLNGEKQKTLHDDGNPGTVLIGKKLGKWAQPGDKLSVRSSSGALSAEYTYTP
jgi:uncharacterized protein DUF4114/BACON domain-containing protein